MFWGSKDLFVIGGGDTAVEEAIYLTNFVNKVTLIHRRDTLRAEQIMQDRLFKNEKIEVIWNSVLDEVTGNDSGVTGINIKNINNGETSSIKLDGVFIAIGHKPATDIFKGKLEMDSEGYLITKPDSTETNIPGVFAAGDVKDKVFRQAIVAAGMGCMAALEADKYLLSLE